MGRFSFRAGVNAEQPDFEIIEPDRRDKVRRLVVNQDGTVDEVIVAIPGMAEES